MNDFSKLLSPYRLKGLDLPNRIVMAPMTRSRSPGGIPTPEVAEYYRRRAEKGVGLILTEATGIARAASINEPDIPLFHGAAALAGWRGVVDAVHAAGGRIMPQLWHAGAKTSNLGREWTSPAPYESPSGLGLNGAPFGVSLSESDIADVIDAFACASADASTLEFDGIELHAGHGYLINQFFFDHLNRRTDRYGGANLIERSRFAVETTQAVRRATGAAFPVVMRLSQWKPGEFDMRLAETPDVLLAFLQVLIDAGVDAFDLSQQRYWEPAFPEFDTRLNFAGWVKKLTGVTSITVGSVGMAGDVYASLKGGVFGPASLAPLLERLRDDEFDLVAVGRPLLQDAAWLEKVVEGRDAEIGSFSLKALESLD